ncbi:reverse transcriptase domain-containing protein [Tanacetum coccineum]
MPLSIWKKLSLLELTPTQMILELTDRSTTRPAGITEDVFVKVGKFHFPTDFIVVDYVVDPQVPLILERPFLRTRRALIDVYGEELTLCHDDEAVTFKVGQTSSFYYNDAESINRIDVIDVACEEYAQEVLGFLEISAKETDAFLVIEDDSILLEINDVYYDLEGDILDELPKLELKYIPSHLEYAFLEGTDKLPVIMAKDLKDKEKDCLLEDDSKPAIQHQRRVNPKIHEVIKKEVIKLLDAGLIYPISDSPWVSPVHCVPKKGGMTVIANDDNELISTQLVTGWRSGIEVDKAKVDVIAKLPHPTSVKGIRSFLGHVGFYRRFIQDFSKIARPMTHLLEKDTPFIFSKECIESFNTLKKKLTEAPILVAPDWDLPFEIMCDASDYAVGAVLGQCKTKHFQPIYYASKTMMDAQAHYTMTEKELLAVVYAFEKFWPYLVLSKTIVYTDHSTLKYLLVKQDAKPILLQWILLLQEFDVIIHDKKGAENLSADHLSRLENPHQDVLENKEIIKTFPLETLGMVTFRGDDSTPWFANFANYHAGNFVIKGMSSQQKNKFFKFFKVVQGLCGSSDPAVCLRPRSC